MENKIYESFLKAQKEIKHAQKDSQNPHFRNSYASIESVLDGCKKILNENGLALIQLMGKDDHGHYVETVIFNGSGEIKSRTYLVLTKNDMQGLGSAITYARRYNLQAFLGMASEDDDGNESSKVVLLNQAQIEELDQLIIDSGADRAEFLKFIKVTKLGDLKQDYFQKAKDLLLKKIKEENK